MCPYFCKNLSVVQYRKFRNVPILKDFPPICPYFLGFRVGKYVFCWGGWGMWVGSVSVISSSPCGCQDEKLRKCSNL